MRGPDAIDAFITRWMHAERTNALLFLIEFCDQLGLSRYLTTVGTVKHRPFCFPPISVIPDNMLVCVATDNTSHLGVLSSRFHIALSVAAGDRLRIGNDPRYNKTRCFDLPFPTAFTGQQADIADLAEELADVDRTRPAGGPQSVKVLCAPLFARATYTCSGSRAAVSQLRIRLCLNWFRD